jgi:hypothetical protein
LTDKARRGKMNEILEIEEGISMASEGPILGQGLALN